MSYEEHLNKIPHEQECAADIPSQQLPGWYRKYINNMKGRPCLENCRRCAAEKAVAHALEESADRKRLDWLVTSGAHIAFSKDGDDCWLHWAYNQHDEEGDGGQNQKGCFNSPREAIDAQMKEEGR